MKIGRKEVGLGEPVYFIADIASNHDGDLYRARRLIYLAAESGADAVKFQSFRADTIVSDYGFKQLGQQSHQSDWKDSVYETYRRYELPLEWIPELKNDADEAGVEFLVTPYDINTLDELNKYVAAWKIGSGDITYEALIKQVSGYGKPVILATGASDLKDIERALHWMDPDCEIVVMQCNTNYTNSHENFNHINLKVLHSWWGAGLLGLSDHTRSHSTVLGAVALAAKIIEKHFTDDNLRDGPDHKFSITPVRWREMVDHTRELEMALSGDGIKKVEENERETVVLQRRAIRAKVNIRAGENFSHENLVCLRPCPLDALPPYKLGELIGQKARKDILAGDCIRDTDV